MFKKRKKELIKEEEKPHAHCSICGIKIEHRDPRYLVQFGFGGSQRYVLDYTLCDECMDKVREAWKSSSKSASRVKREKGYF